MSARDLLAAATPRPWSVEHFTTANITGDGGNIYVAEIDCSHESGDAAAQAHADADLIVATVNEYEAHDALAEEARRMAGRARGAADVLRGIPAFMAQWSTFDDIARNLERELDRLDAVRRST